jgi:hypothetical protein
MTFWKLFPCTASRHDKRVFGCSKWEKVIIIKIRKATGGHRKAPLVISLHKSGYFKNEKFSKTKSFHLMKLAFPNKPNNSILSRIFKFKTYSMYISLEKYGTELLTSVGCILGLSRFGYYTFTRQCKYLCNLFLKINILDSEL